MDDFYYNAPYQEPYDQQLIMDMFQRMLIVALSLAFITLIVVYIFNSIGLYKIAKNRGYKKAWLAWIPVFSSYIIGGTYDDINRLKGKTTKFRIILLCLCAAYTVLYIFSISSSMQFFFTSFDMAFSQQPYELYSSSPYLGNVVLTLILLPTSTVLTVLNLIALYTIFKDHDERHCVLYTVLSVFGISPFLLFAIRNKPSSSIFYANVSAQNQQAANPTPFAYENTPSDPTQL